ncbi:hypothetical protein [Elioraea sp.]|nr:hypothetical protein [Elioraea sp.]
MRKDGAPAVQVRQGITPGIVRYVLAVSLVLVVIGFALSWLFA